jgi:homocitrate synthase NifV
MVTKIIDCTLREGQQASGVYFTGDERRQVIAGLGAFGVDEIEIGPAAPDSGMAEIVKEIRVLAPKSRSAVWCRCLERDITLAIADGSDAISISLPVSDLHLEKRLKKNRQWALKQIGIAAKLVRECGREIYLSVGLEDASRADVGFLVDVVCEAEKQGFDRVRLADTVGIFTPSSIKALFEVLRRHASISLGVHTHNDFGMATANAISATESGAEWADASVLGLGERAGITRLEEIGGYLAIREGHTEYDIRVLAPLVQFVSTITKTTVSSRHPIVGESLFHCESGIHLDGLAKSEEMYQAFPPALLGMKAGASAVKLAVGALDLSVTPGTIQDLTSRIRTTSRHLGRSLSESELLAMVREFSRPALERA